ncbi:SDR family oxidoreductase [Microaerobacter geothermalis]|uniref:SDR family NAD(P)-dependent oxidoreductase n=1 Tax=Microaerobacter geothermalis TaxID=674972 RepID=UPI001F32F0E5|nr:SDR family NAD(P)-dependent oxidoreductase [Microaerobacter geothermalis]MCF6094857.1 SDR family oxidoreductase [Microaerobacter geothermalis]
MSRLKNKVAFVTGGGQGIGKAIAARFAEEGARVYVMEINEELINKTSYELQNQGLPVYSLVGDVTSRVDVETHIEYVINKEGHIDILVNNAGIIRDNLVHKMTDDDWDTVISVHLKGTFICCQAAQKHMVRQKQGKIINISSTSALGNRGQANYAAAKAGIQGFTKTLAIELGPFGIQVNAVAPGFIETEMTRSTAKRLGISFEELVEKKKAMIPLRRSGKPEDIANAVLFFASDESDFVSGQVLYVRGGP